MIPTFARRTAAGLILVLCSALLQSPAFAQGLRETIAADTLAASSIYRSYSYEAQDYAKVPKGYTPVYAAVYARHGSRWLGNPSEYTRPLSRLEKADSAGLLTPVGKSLLRKVRIIAENARNREGSLSPQGWRQHQEIAWRLCDREAPLFKGECKVIATSTKVPRSILSMASFCDGLKDKRPDLDIRMIQDAHTQDIDNFFTNGNKEVKELIGGSPWKALADSTLKNFNASAFMERIFTDSVDINPYSLAGELYYLAGDQQDVDTGISLYEAFSLDDLYWLAVWDSWRFYNEFGAAPYSYGYNEMLATKLLRDIISKADKALSGGDVSADLHFGHDINLIGLTGLMELKQFDPKPGERPLNPYISEKDPCTLAEKWLVSEVAPMACNIQIIFYRGKGDVLVKVLVNEKEMALPLEAYSGPYYRWKDVKDYYLKKMDGLSFEKVRSAYLSENKE
jgi:hypothetical protein